MKAGSSGFQISLPWGPGASLVGSVVRFKSWEQFVMVYGRSEF